MSAPERIWAVHHETQGAVMIGEWADTVRHLGGTEYIRADLVQALVEASKGLLFAHDHGNGLEGWHNTRERMRAALRAIEEDKP